MTESDLFSRMLCVGSAGTAVASLQQLLVDDGDATLAVTSYFGAPDARFLDPVAVHGLGDACGHQHS